MWRLTSSLPGNFELYEGHDGMNFEYTDRQKRIIATVSEFLEKWVFPAEATIKQQITDFGDDRWQVIPELEKLKARAKAAGLWNMFMPPSSGQEPLVLPREQVSAVEPAFLRVRLGRKADVDEAALQIPAIST